MFTPIKREPNGFVNEMAFQTPQAQISFSKELRQVLQERNLLTAKTRKKVCSMLNGSNCSTPLGGGTPNPEADKRRGFRLQAIQEILNSEKAYLNQLELLMQFFVRPLKEQAIIDDASYMALFGQIEMIHNLNGEFLRELENNLENVAQSFLKMAPFFKLYSVYAFDYRNALIVLQELTSKNPVFRKFLQQTESRPEVQRKLNSLMIVPIQRVPRYKLLLEQVLLYTSPADSDFKLLKESVKQIESTVSHINSCIEDQEVTLLLINLQNSLVNRTPNIVKPSRKVIKEGVLHKVTRNGTEIKRYCVLMSDIFMYCKILKERQSNTIVENSLECCCIFPLKKCKVYEMFPGTFKVTCQGDGIIFSTNDLQFGRAWVGFIRDAIDLHIQCRQTLRKESSKRKPIRKKDIKNFDTDFILSPTKRKCEYETIFRNKNRSSDSEGEQDSIVGISCFSRKKTPIPHKTIPKTIQPIQKSSKALKRPAPPPPPPPPPSTTFPVQDRMSKLCKFMTNDKTSKHGILKRTHASTTTSIELNAQQPSCTDQEATYFTVSRYSDSKSYLRAHNVDNTIPTAIVKREDVLNAILPSPEGNGNFRDVLFPLRSSGGSNKSGNSGGWSTNARSSDKENEIIVPPPQKKRVKFDDSEKTKDNGKAKAFVFPNELTNFSTIPKMSLRDKIFDFFSKLF